MKLGGARPLYNRPPWKEWSASPMNIIGCIGFYVWLHAKCAPLLCYYGAFATILDCVCHYVILLSLTVLFILVQILSQPLSPIAHV